MLFIKAKKLIFLDGFVNKAIALSIWLTWSCVFGQEKVQLMLANGSSVNGEFIGTYMNHIHLLINEKLVYYSCDQVLSIANVGILKTEYDCSKNTVTPDILFSPQLNPMTGEWETVVPEPFILNKKEFPTNKESMEKENQQEPNAQLDINKKLQIEPFTFKNGTKEAFPLKGVNNNTSASTLSKYEVIKLIKKEVRKEVRKTLPYELRKQKKEKQFKFVQNILLGCGAWFFLMIMFA